MGIWDRLKRAVGGDPDPAPRPPEPADGPRSEPSRAEAGGAGGASRPWAAELSGSAGSPTEADALAALARARGSPSEGEALAVLAPIARERGFERLAIACAEALARRGRRDAAVDALEGVAGGPALLLLADLLEETGEHARALAAVERVLARDLGAPGAEERHARLRARLGGRARAGPRSGDVTLVTPRGGKDRFRILREVARGGAGVVFEAEELELGRTVAFKLYHPAQGGPAAERARREGLLHEARAAVRFRGPGVVRLFDLDPEEGWITYEWVPRASARDRIRAGDAGELAPLRRWAIPLATALARVHAAGWVHGDLKPANVLLRSPDEPVLTDFGLATALGGRLPPGSAGYESPERLVDAQALASEDVYAFGRVLEDVAGPAGDRSLDGVIRAALAPRGARPRDAAALLELLSRVS